MRVLRCRSPPVPERTGGGIAERLRTCTPAHHRTGDAAAQFPAGEELSDRPALGAAQRQTLVPHRAAGQCIDDSLRRACAEHLGRWRTRIVGVMTRGAVGSEEGSGIARSIRLPRECAGDERQHDSRSSRQLV